MELISALLKVLIGIALVATVVVLIAGVISMARGGSFNARWGSKLMRLRVLRAVRGGGVARRPHGGDVQLSIGPWCG